MRNPTGVPCSPRRERFKRLVTLDRLKPVADGAVARDIDGDGAFHQAEQYWLNDEGEATRRFLSDLVRGMTAVNIQFLAAWEAALK